MAPLDALETKDRQVETSPNDELIIEGESLAKLPHIPNVASPQGESIVSSPNKGEFVVGANSAAVSSLQDGVVILDEESLGTTPAATTTFTVAADPTISPVLSLLTAKSEA